MTTQRQKQKIPKSQKNPKTKKGREWWENNIDYYETKSTSYSIHKETFMQLYRLAAGKLNETDYTYVTNPFNETRQELMGFPAKMKNYDIVSPIIQLLMGEKGKRPENKTVIARNSDIKNIRKQEETKIWRETLIQTFVNHLNKTGVDTGIESKETKTLEEIQADTKNIPDVLSQSGQEGLEYIYDYNEIPRQYKEGFLDWLVTARVFSYKGIRNKDTDYMIVSPIDFNYIASRNTTFVEDAEAAWRETRMTLAEVVDWFGDSKQPGGGLKPEDLTSLEQDYDRTGSNKTDRGYMSQTDVFYRSLFKIDERDYERDRGIRIVHIVWTSMEKYGKRTWTDAFGQTQVDDVDEDYKPSEDETVEWKWINVPYEGYKIDDKYYVGLQRLPIKRGSFENPSASKLPYNGRIFGSNHTSPVSITEKLMSYQIQHNILHYRGEMLMAKAGDRPLVFPLGLLPDKEGWDMYKSMYYVRATNFLYVDETKPNALAALNALKSIDMGLGTYISQLNSYLLTNKQEAEDSVGISRQRKGAVMASDSVGGTQEAVFRSTVTTEELFMQYEEWQRREDQGLLDLSKYAWAGGKKANYINSEEKIAFLEINPEDYGAAEFAVFAKNAGKELKKLEDMRAAAHAFAQNQASPLTIGKIIGEDNFSKMLESLEKLENDMKQQQQAAGQAEQQATQAETQFKVQEHEDTLEFKYYDADLKSNTQLELKLLDTENALLATDSEGNTLEVDKLIADITGQRESLQVQREQIQSNERIADKKNKSAEKVAKENKNRFDTPKAKSNGKAN